MTEESRTRVYELGYILVPTTSESEVASEVDILKGVITTTGGTIHSEGAPEFIDLAYTMEKNVASKKLKWSQGYFGWMKFETTPDMLIVLKKAYDANLALVRYILLKTAAENTIVFKKPKVEALRHNLEDQEEINDELTDESVSGDDMKEYHEKLPELDADAPSITADVVEPEEKEEV